MSKGYLDIDLLDTKFAIQADETDEYLSKLYRHFQNMLEQVKNTSSVTDPTRLAIITGILIADEFYKEQLKKIDYSKISQDDFVIEEATSRMIEKIDLVLESNNENLG